MQCECCKTELVFNNVKWRIPAKSGGRRWYYCCESCGDVIDKMIGPGEALKAQKSSLGVYTIGVVVGALSTAFVIWICWRRAKGEL